MADKGFLGTSASVLADISLILGLFVALTLTVGVIMARRRQYQAHRWIQTTAVSLNVLQVLAIMIASFYRSAVPGIPARLGETYFLAAASHASLGAFALILGTFVALRGNDLVPQALRFKRRYYKRFMRTAYTMYMVVTALGVWVYLSWYTGSPGPLAVTAVGKNELIVPMANFDYNPPQLTIPIGTTIIWVNQDGAPHTVTADDGKVFRSDLISNGQRFQHTFGQAGEFAYFCELHGSAGGLGMHGAIRVVAADQAPPLVAASVAIATPTPQPTPHPLPAQPLGQPAGTAAFRDARGRSDQIVINVRTPQPGPGGIPAGQALAAFLTTPDGSAVQPLGLLQPGGSAGVARLEFTAPNGENLAARYSRLLITIEPSGSTPARPTGRLVFEGTLPEQAFLELGKLLANGPGLSTRQGYVVGVRLETDELLRHVKLIGDAQAVGDVNGMRRHAEHSFNLIVGSRHPQFGDLNHDGQSQNAGDGFGLLENGDQAGYIKATFDSARAAEAAPDATTAIKVHAKHVQISAQNMHGWAVEAREVALKLTEVSDVRAAEEHTARLLTLAKWLNLGNDLNGDGEIAPVAGEGGGMVAYEHAQFMAGFGLFAPR